MERLGKTEFYMATGQMHVVSDHVQSSRRHRISELGYIKAESPCRNFFFLPITNCIDKFSGLSSKAERATWEVS